MSIRLGEIFRSVSSTNDLIKKAIDHGMASGYAVRAFEQSGGYGRQGRTWVSPVGGVYQSVLLRPEVEMEQIPILALVASIAVCRALRDWADEHEDCTTRARDIFIKWPNDIVTAQGKLCGISSEYLQGAVCCGIGVNVYDLAAQDASPEEESADLDQSWIQQVEEAARQTAIYGGIFNPVYLYDHPVDRYTMNLIGDAILRELDTAYEQWCAQGFGSMRNTYLRYQWLLGREVRIADMGGRTMNDENGLLEGVVQGVDKSGHLLVCDDAETIHVVGSGEAHLV